MILKRVSNYYRTESLTSNMADNEGASGTQPLTRADIPSIVKAIVAALKAESKSDDLFANTSLQWHNHAMSHTHVVYQVKEIGQGN